ncbi:amino acid-binding protein, partial [Halogeometricum sp. CBA1124]|nr:amino acid-binding protein [Halogeometricum sp. CBA1124]
SSASLSDVSLNAPEGRDDVSSASLRLATHTGRTEAALDVIREVAAEKDLHVVEPLTEASL